MGFFFLSGNWLRRTDLRTCRTIRAFLLINLVWYQYFKHLCRTFFLLYVFYIHLWNDTNCLKQDWMVLRISYHIWGAVCNLHSSLQQLSGHNKLVHHEGESCERMEVPPGKLSLHPASDLNSGIEKPSCWSFREDILFLAVANWLALTRVNPEKAPIRPYLIRKIHFQI